MLTNRVVAQFKRAGGGSKHIHPASAVKPGGCVGRRGKVFSCT